MIKRRSWAMEQLIFEFQILDLKGDKGPNSFMDDYAGVNFRVTFRPGKREIEESGYFVLDIWFNSQSRSLSLLKSMGEEIGSALS